MNLPTAQIAVTLIHPDAHLPTVIGAMSIGADIHAYLRSESGRPIKMLIPPNMTRIIPTGIVAVVEPPFSMFVCSRSGLAAQRTLFVTNAPGVIDPDYVGEIKVLLHNAGTENQWVEHGDRIAQIVVLPIPFPRVLEANMDLRKLTTDRGSAGFGSTGR